MRKTNWKVLKTGEQLFQFIHVLIAKEITWILRGSKPNIEAVIVGF